MSNLKSILTTASCFVCVAVAAQKRVSGHVWSKEDGPIIMATVREVDASNRTVSSAQTDVNGNFSMNVKNPEKNKLVVSYIGYVTYSAPIGARTSFRIELQDRNTIQAAEVKARRTTKSNGLVIPEREISVAKQTLNMDDMKGLSFETAGEALQGQIAGLDIVMNSGNLGAGTSMRLRGVSSINGNQEPLIVVNGEILENHSSTEIDYSNLENEEQFATLLQVSPEDIQSINVLKDAAATAIWGSRGSNGVIEIKTRRGSRGKTRVNASYRFTGSWQPSGYKMLTGDEYTMMLKEAYFNPRQSDLTSAIVELMYLQSHTAYYGNYNKNTDWVKEVTQFGQSHNANFSVSGGGEKALFRISGVYDHSTGTIIQQMLDRLSTRLALDYYVSDRIKFTSDFALVYTKNKKNHNDYLLSAAYKAMPNMAITRQEYREGADGTGAYYDTGEWYIMPRKASAAGMVANNSGLSSYYLGDMVDNGNPVATAYESWRNQSTYTIQPKISLEYKLLGKEDAETQLNYSGDVYMDMYTENMEYYFPALLSSGSWNENINKTSNNEYKSVKFVTRHGLTFRPHFYNENHSFQMMAQVEMQTNNNSSQFYSSSGISGGISDPTVPGYLTGMTTGTGKGHGMSAYTSMHYSYGSKYSLDFSLRADGSTRFGDDKKWGIFPGISGRWNVSDENFFKPLKETVSMFAIRAGWGITGNSDIQEGVIYNTYGNSGSYNGTSAIVPTNLKLTSIRWEKTKSWNLGFNLGILQDLVTFDLNIYNRKTTDLLNKNVSIPSSTGFSTLASANVGSMENKGWELFINTGKFLQRGKFSMSARVNFAQNLNTITSMEPTVLSANNTEFNYSNEKVLNRVQVGHALGGIYGFRYKGVYAYDYDHNGYFLNESKNKYFDADGNRNTAKATNKTAPIVYDAQGKIIYDANGDPLPMIYNYGGVNYQFQGGDVIYDDINHDGTIDKYDIVYLGSSNPDINGGFGVDFNYGNWRLKTNFNFRLGNKIINLSRMYVEDMRTNKNQSAAVNWRWRKNGQETEIPRAMNESAGASYNALISDRYVESGNFLRFQYLQLSYNVPTAKLERYGLSSLNFAASVNNLFVLTRYKGLDPEHSAGGYSPAYDNSQTPRSRSFTVSVSLGF